jgi:hypothetical protein
MNNPVRLSIPKSKSDGGMLDEGISQGDFYIYNKEKGSELYMT